LLERKKKKFIPSNQLFLDKFKDLEILTSNFNLPNIEEIIKKEEELKTQKMSIPSAS